MKSKITELEADRLAKKLTKLIPEEAIITVYSNFVKKDIVDETAIDTDSCVDLYDRARSIVEAGILNQIWGQFEIEG